MEEKLYMMALVPPTTLSKSIEEIRKEFATAYHCKAALKPPVHITLYPPYKELESHEEEAKNILSKWASGQLPFEITLHGFDAFKNNGVLFINVIKTEALKQLHKSFSLQMTRLLQPTLLPNSSFNPHITIGYRDIPKELFPEAMKDFLPRKFEASFIADHIFFWKHNGKIWNTIASFPLKNENSSIRQTILF